MGVTILFCHMVIFRIFWSLFLCSRVVVITFLFWLISTFILIPSAITSKQKAKTMVKKLVEGDKCHSLAKSVYPNSYKRMFGSSGESVPINGIVLRVEKRQVSGNKNKTSFVTVKYTLHCGTEVEKEMTIRQVKEGHADVEYTRSEYSMEKGRQRSPSSPSDSNNQSSREEDDDISYTGRDQDNTLRNKYNASFDENGPMLSPFGSEASHTCSRSHGKQDKSHNDDGHLGFSPSQDLHSGLVDLSPTRDGSSSGSSSSSSSSSPDSNPRQKVVNIRNGRKWFKPSQEVLKQRVNNSKVPKHRNWILLGRGIRKYFARSHKKYETSK